MNITVKQIRDFLAVAETGGFAEACTIVSRTQPALSTSIKNLELAVGGKLFSRTTRTLTLTPEGRAFLPKAQRLMKDWDQAFDDLHKQFVLQRGKVFLAAIPSLAGNLLPGALAEYHRRHPQVDISVDDVITESVVDMVRSGRAEIGITFDPGPVEDMDFQVLFQESFVAILPAGHPLSFKRVVKWQELLNYGFIALQKPSSVRDWMETQLGERDMRIAPTYEAHQLFTIGRMVSEGLGVSAVPSMTIQQMVSQGVAVRQLEGPLLTRPIGLLTRRRYPLSMAAQAMQDVLCNQRWSAAFIDANR